MTFSFVYRNQYTYAICTGMAFYYGHTTVKPIRLMVGILERIHFICVAFIVVHHIIE